MADKKTTALTELAAGAVAADDLVPIVDASASETKKVQVQNLCHYKKYVALLTQSGTDAPVATVLENTLGGTVVWTRNDFGHYTATLSGAFTANKTVIFLGRSSAEGVADLAPVSFFRSKVVSANAVDLASYQIDVSGPSAALADSLLLNTEVEIRVYP